MKIIDREALLWPKNKIKRIYELEDVCGILGDEEAFHFFRGVLGFVPDISGAWDYLQWIKYLDGYIFDVFENKPGSEEVLEMFNEVFVKGESYFHYIDKEWYI